MSSSQPAFSSRVTFPCPACGARMSTLAVHAGRSGRCAHCRHVIPIPELAVSPKTTDTPRVSPSPKRPHPAIDDDLPNIDIALKAGPTRRTLRRHDQRFPVVPLSILVVILSVAFIALGSTREESLDRFSHALENLPGLLMLIGVVVALYVLSVHKVRRLRHLVYFTVWFGPHLFVALVLPRDAISPPGPPGESFPFLACFILLWTLFGRYPAHWVTPIILALLVQRLKCPSCHEAHELVDRWQCSCGYMDHRQRNILLFHCPKCQNYVSYTECPRCDSTILI